MNTYECILPFFFRPILFGFISGSVCLHFVSPIKFLKNENYLRLIGFNLASIIVITTISFYTISKQFSMISISGSIQTNTIFALFTCLVCFVTSLVLFGLFRLPKFTNKAILDTQYLKNITMVFDSNYYLFFLNAYLCAAFIENTLDITLLIMIGFILSILLNNLINYKKSLVSKQI